MDIYALTIGYTRARPLDPRTIRTIQFGHTSASFHHLSYPHLHIISWKILNTIKQSLLRLLAVLVPDVARGELYSSLRYIFFFGIFMKGINHDTRYLFVHDTQYLWTVSMIHSNSAWYPWNNIFLGLISVIHNVNI